jgi:acyl-homoserine lactone acylase PvdQ
MRRVLATALITALVLTSFGAPVIAQDDPPEMDDPMRAYSIVPPGQDGEVTMLEFATLGLGDHYDDQLGTYADLIDDNDVTDAEIQNYFHSMQFGPQGEVEDEYSPTEGVTVLRDELGIPHIYAEGLEQASFALGYVTAEDRLWESDVFRHAARGTLSEFIGPDFLEMDIETRREGYTEEEIQAMFDSFDNKFGKIGKQVQLGLEAYANGFNEYIGELPTSPDACPAEYAATDNPCPFPFPEEWTPADTLFLVVLQLRIFGETAGGELQNAGLYALLTKKLGKKLGPKVFEDFMFQNETSSPVSIPDEEGAFWAQDLGSVNQSAVAIPDNAEKIGEEEATRQANRRRLIEALGLTTPSSNALLLSGRESTTGNPMQIGAPQVGYATPSFFMDVDVHAPGVDFRGPAVPGTSALIPLGRGQDYAWSLTTGFSDAVDVRVERLCNPEGGKVEEDANHYMFKGKCLEMEERNENFLIKPSAASPGPPGSESETFYRTVHGPVFDLGKIGGNPVAFVKERFFWMKELDSIPQFYRWNAEVDSLADFREAASKFTMSFNSFYADHRNIAYFHVGHYPVRKKGVHPALPSWGTGQWEWQGRLPFGRHPKVVNPAQGWVANWNNKPAVGWNSHDGIKWGSIQRVQLLMDRMEEVTAGGRKASLSDLVDVIRDAATRDTRGVYLGPTLVRWADDASKRDSKEAQAVDIVRNWIKVGAHRVNHDHDDEMDDGPALAIFDEWFDVLVHKVFDDELGTDAYELLEPMGAPVTDYTPETGSSFWFDFSSYLHELFDPRERAGLARNYCDNMVTPTKESCPDVVAEALTLALKQLAEDQEEEDMTQWTVEAENIVFQELGLGSVDEIPWQNRGTHNHVVEILRKGRDG